jgi:hypothetical protein
MGDRTLAKARFVHDALSFETFAARKFAIIKHHQPETVLCGLIPKMLVTTAPEIPGIVTHDFLLAKACLQIEPHQRAADAGCCCFRLSKTHFSSWCSPWIKGWYHTHEALLQVGEIKGYRDPHKTFKPSTLPSIRVAKSRI